MFSIGNILKGVITNNPLVSGVSSLIRNVAQKKAGTPATSMGINSNTQTPEATLATATAPKTTNVPVSNTVKATVSPTVTKTPVNAPIVPEAPQTPQAPQIAGFNTATPTTTIPQSYQDAINMLAQLSTMSGEEKAARSDLADFQKNTRLSIEGEAQRRIPKGFVGARQGQIARTAAAEEGNLIQNISNLMSERELAMNATKSIVDAQKPVPLTVGTGLVSPTSGQTVAGGVFGEGVTSVPAGTAFRQGDPFDEAVRQYMNTGDIPAKYNIPAFSSQIQARADDLFKQSGQGDTFNPIARKQGVASDTASLKEVQSKIDVQAPAIQSFSATAQNMLQTMNNAGLNQSNVPLKNAIDNLVSRGIWTSAERAKFNQQLDALVTDYARAKTGKSVLAVDDKKTYEQLISPNFTPQVLATIIGGIKQELGNDLDANTKQLQTIQGRIQGVDFNKNKSSSSDNIFAESWI